MGRLSLFLRIFKHTYPVKVFRQKAAIVIFPLNDTNLSSYEKDHMITEILTRQSWQNKINVSNIILPRNRKTGLETAWIPSRHQLVQSKTLRINKRHTERRQFAK